jgi:hypothetical protein
MTFQQWIQIVGPILGALIANFFELRKLRHEMMADRKIAHERHEHVTDRLDRHDDRISALEKVA